MAKVSFGSTPAPTDATDTTAMPTSQTDTTGYDDIVPKLEAIKAAIQSGDNEAALGLIDQCLAEHGQGQDQGQGQTDMQPGEPDADLKAALRK